LDAVVIQDSLSFDFGAMGLGFENISDVIKGVKNDETR